MTSINLGEATPVAEAKVEYATTKDTAVAVFTRGLLAQVQPVISGNLYGPFTLAQLEAEDAPLHDYNVKTGEAFRANNDPKKKDSRVTLKSIERKVNETTKATGVRAMIRDGGLVVCDAVEWPAPERKPRTKKAAVKAA